jgi:uncharacterized RDD family membrane protein YckC
VAVKSRDLRRRLVTPEGIDLGVVLGEMGQRAGAFLLDALLLCVILIVMTLIAIFGVFGVGEKAWQPVAIIWLLGFFVLRNGYFIAMEMRPRAATFGKRWVGLRVVARDGGRLTGDAVIARNLMREIEVFLPLSFMAGGGGDSLTSWFGFGWTAIFLFFPWFNKDRLRVGDLLAGTWVIQTRPRKLVSDLAAARADASYDFTPAQMNTYGVYELQTLENVLRKSEAASRLTVAQAIIDKIGWPHDVPDIDAFLNAYYTQLRAHLEQGLLLGKRREDKHDVVGPSTAFTFTTAQLSVYGELEYETLGTVIRSSDAAAKLTVAQAIINKIGWQSDVTDIDGFLKAYYGQLRNRYESGMMSARRTGVANAGNGR